MPLKSVQGINLKILYFTAYLKLVERLLQIFHFGHVQTPKMKSNTEVTGVCVRETGQKNFQVRLKLIFLKWVCFGVMPINCFTGRKPTVGRFGRLQKGLNGLETWRA